MQPARERRATVIVVHDAALSPQHHSRHGRAEQNRSRGSEGRWLGVEWPEWGRGPVLSAISRLHSPPSNRPSRRAWPSAAAKVAFIVSDSKKAAG